MLEGIREGQGQRAKVGVPRLDVATLPLQFDWGRRLLPIPSKQEHFEYSEVVGLHGGQHRHFDDRLGIGLPRVSGQEPEAERRQTEEPQNEVEGRVTCGGRHLKASVTKLVTV
jgi:hypothetical protein